MYNILFNNDDDNKFIPFYSKYLLVMMMECVSVRITKHRLR